VETRVRGDMGRLWTLTQDPVQHARWDARFTTIEHLPTPEGDLQRFRYAVTLLPGLTLAGVGVSAGERRRADGSRTSALRFSTERRLSPLRAGSGYWRYVPGRDGIRFLTGYDYEPGFQGRLADAVLVRPLMGLMTAWSFDRLRLWVETGLEPERSRRRSLAVAGVRLLGAGLAVRRRSPWSLPVAGAALLLPVPIERPRARRCLRRAPDRLGRTAPATLAGMDPPSAAARDVSS
jgi:hypothetical protein